MLSPAAGSHHDLLDVLGKAAQAPGATLALLMVEITEVTMLQARLGHAASAVLLGQLTDAFSQIVADRGAIVQFGGGRYAIVISGIRNRGHAVLAAEKLLRVADESFATAELISKPRLHVGIALFPLQSADLGQLLRFAQLALATALQQSARFLVYDEAKAGQVVQCWELRDSFARALDTGELSVYYQPKISTLDGRTAGVEALLRWFKDGRPVSTPDVFVPLAEEAGLIHTTTWYVLSNALRFSTECGGLPVAVNITPQMLHHAELMGMVSTALATYGANQTALTLEITEGALMSDFDQASKRLSALRHSGVRISIDDFGTGYSSLSYFKKIPADELKIDKSFVMRMLQDPADHQLVETILRRAQQFKLATVAEGVEDRATYDALVTLGCDYVQGYLFAPALEPLRMRAWLGATARG